MKKIISIVIGYLFGSFLTAELVAKAKGKNVREIDPYAQNEGNPGFANVAINMGLSSGILVLIGDILKLVIAYSVIYFLYKDYRLFLFAGFGVLLGHDFSFLHQFNGGKGVLVTIFWYLTIMPLYSFISFLICIAIVLITGYLNLAAITLPIVMIPFAYLHLNKVGFLLVILSAMLMLLRNKKDIQKLLNGTLDRHFFFKKDKN